MGKLSRWTLNAVIRVHMRVSQREVRPQTDTEEGGMQMEAEVGML